MNLRYVITHINSNGMRTLADPAQGRFTYATHDEAQRRIDAIMASNNFDCLNGIYGLPLEVREVECWPNHNDPKGIWFD